MQSASREGATDASEALGKWIGRPALMTLESIDQLPLADATEILGGEEEPMCFCSMCMPSSLPGKLLVAFDDASGWSLADMLHGHATGTSSQWGESEQSAALESTNIL